MASQRLESLDSIRGLAALLVLLSHTFGVFDWPTNYLVWSHWPGLNILIDGRSAVTMFFVLSGFVLARPYLTVPRKVLYIPPFYIRRGIRIWLPWFFVFLTSLVARHWLMRDWQTEPPVSGWLSHFWHQTNSWKDLIKQCFFQLHDPARLLMPQDWSLGVELKGSALIPLFLILAHWRWSNLWLGLLALLFYIFLNSGGYYISFIIGVVLAKYSDAWIASFRSMSFNRQLWLLALGLIGYASRWTLPHFRIENHWADKTIWVVTSLSCALIIIASLSSRRINGFLIKRPLVFVGHISYSVYLLQFVILICFVPPLIHWLNQFQVHTYELFIITLLSSFTLTLMFAWAVYRWVELPSIAFGHWLARHFDFRKPDSNRLAPSSLSGDKH